MNEEEREIALFWLQRLEDELEPKKKKEELREKFVGEFGIEPEELSPFMAKRIIKIDDSDILDRLRDCYIASEGNLGRDFDYVELVLVVKRTDDIENTGWKFNRSVILGFTKTQNNFKYVAKFFRCYYDDDC